MVARCHCAVVSASRLVEGREAEATADEGQNITCC